MREVRPEDFTRCVQFGTVTGGHIESLLRLMTRFYAPTFFKNTSWPDRYRPSTRAALALSSFGGDLRSCEKVIAKCCILSQQLDLLYTGLYS